ncbi:hypothetical protein TWF730_001072 [Orbilia blumenaviensis]|uniref:Uncharacterized protein n=1 Tax=Orbilia blumenaviensis TaxID=1796055 RepID=A0AAV9VPQ8_9PEZI
MTFWKSWSNLYRFLFVLGGLFVLWVLISFLCRVISARFRRKLEAGYQLELVERPPEPTQVQRSRSVNFGVRALDSHETPVEAGIVDSESLRVFSPASRFSRISSPASTGGRKGSASTIGSVYVPDVNAAGLNVYGQLSHMPQLKYVPQMVPRGLPPFVSPGLQAMQGQAAAGLRGPPMPVDNNNVGRPSSASPSFHTAPTTPLQGDIGEYFMIPTPHPYCNYLEVPSHNHRHFSNASINIGEVVTGLPQPPQSIAKPILKLQGQGLPATEPSKSEQSITPDGSAHNIPIQIPQLGIPTSVTQVKRYPPRSRSAPPLKTRQSSDLENSNQSLTDIPEVPVETLDGVEGKSLPRGDSNENIPSLAVPKAMNPPLDSDISQPTRVVSPGYPTQVGTKRNAGFRNKGKGRAYEPWREE